MTNTQLQRETPEQAGLARLIAKTKTDLSNAKSQQQTAEGKRDHFESLATRLRGELEDTQDQKKHSELWRKIRTAEKHFGDWKYLADKWEQEADRLDALIEKYNSYKSRPRDGHKPPNMAPQHGFKPEFEDTEPQGSYSVRESVKTPLTQDPAFPTLATNKVDLPQLVRRDGQDLSQPESFYPSMAYDKDQHEPWSDEAVVEAVRLYPGLAERKSVANRLAGTTAAQVKLNIDPYRVPEEEEEEEEEEEKYRLPANPTLRNALRHHASGKRKL
jgi:hypothetical protein